MTSERAMSAQDIKSGIERFRLGDRSDVTVLYPDVCFASLEAVGDMPVTLLVESVLAGWRPESQLTTTTRPDSPAPFPVASLVVSRDGPAQFHPELSNREPVEIQVWADGRVSLEIEFQGADVTTVTSPWAATAERVLESWAAPRGVHLVGVFNDRARSLPDVWNASFSVTAPEGHVVDDLVELGERALRTAELSMTGWGGEDDVRRLLANGDVHAVLGWAPSGVLEFWETPPGATQFASFAADVCAFANGVRGGAIVIGVHGGPEGATLQPFVADDHVMTVQHILRDQLFPVPERVVVKHLPVTADDDGRGVLVVQIPPQDELVWPFVVHDRGQQITLVERDGAETITRSVAAVHAALTAGTAYLRGKARS
jgi:hypothetical protein